MSARVYLHNELAAILRARGNAWTTTRELAEAVNARGRYRKGNGTDVTAYQVHGRTKNYTRIFERHGASVRLRSTR